LRCPLFDATSADLLTLAQAARAGDERPAAGRWWTALQALAEADPGSVWATRRARIAGWRDLARQLPVHDLLDRIVPRG
jgi:ATP-dependent exoDNAse (exonuclease V) beta subunit